MINGKEKLFVDTPEDNYVLHAMSKLNRVTRVDDSYYYAVLLYLSTTNYYLCVLLNLF